MARGLTGRASKSTPPNKTLLSVSISDDGD